MIHKRFLMTAFVLTSVCIEIQSAEVDQTTARQTLRATVHSYRSLVGHQGAYLWHYSEDLTKQEGEGRATKTSGWTQPPGTPSVGEAFLKAWRLSGEQACLDAAIECAQALVQSQLESGGWASHFDLAQPGRKRYAYRIDGKDKGRRNHTTFDDNKSQSALMLLMRVDEALDFKNPTIHEAVNYALQKMLAAQYPNGAWPQQFDGPPNQTDHAIKKASYPDSWSREYPHKDYRNYYTLNDNNMSYIVNMLIEAHRIYDRQDCFNAAVKTGTFFLLAQLPEPQPGWAQQYDLNMHPAWARKFEPPAITGGESQAVLKTLLRLYQFTGDPKFISSVPRAIEYYRQSALPNGRLARFYELKTNRPLYFTTDYKLTYSDAYVPTHYSFAVNSRLDSIEAELHRLKAIPRDRLTLSSTNASPVRFTRKLAQQASKVIDLLDKRMLWVTTRDMRTEPDVNRIIDMKTLTKNLPLLAAYAGATR